MPRMSDCFGLSGQSACSTSESCVTPRNILPEPRPLTRTELDGGWVSRLSCSPGDEAEARRWPAREELRLGLPGGSRRSDIEPDSITGRERMHRNNYYFMLGSSQ